MLRDWCLIKLCVLDVASDNVYLQIHTIQYAYQDVWVACGNCYSGEVWRRAFCTKIFLVAIFVTLWGGIAKPAYISMLFRIISLSASPFTLFTAISFVCRTQNWWPLSCTVRFSLAERCRPPLSMCLSRCSGYWAMVRRCCHPRFQSALALTAHSASVKGDATPIFPYWCASVVLLWMLMNHVSEDAKLSDSGESIVVLTVKGNWQGNSLLIQMFISYMSNTYILFLIFPSFCIRANAIRGAKFRYRITGMPVNFHYRR